MESLFTDSIPYSMRDPNHISNTTYKGSSIPVDYSKKYAKRHRIAKHNRKLNRRNRN